MVIVQLKGGLGGQMFQYAAALGLRRAGESLYADLHALFGKDPGAEGYLLHPFPELQFPKVPNLVHRIFNNPDFPWPLLRTLIQGRFIRVTQRGSALAPRLLKRDRSLYLDGPFHNPAYFDKQRAKLLSDFTFPEPEEELATLAAAIASRKDAVAISISRNTDSEDAAPEGPSLKYYAQCIAALRAESEQPYFYVFTNDPAWARQLSIFDEADSAVIGPEVSGVTVMQLKSRCAHHVTAGNADDWWGAWLSRRNGRKFIPSEWYGSDAESTTINDLAPEGWTVVPAR